MSTIDKMIADLHARADGYGTGSAYEDLRRIAYECDAQRLQALKERNEANDKLLRISALFNAWANGDEPEGAPSARRTVLAIGEILGRPF